MHITYITEGTNGDIRPAIALSLGLQQAGHRVTLVVQPPENKELIIKYGLECITFEYSIEFLDFLGQLWTICKANKTKAIICSDVRFYCAYIAEELQIPCYIASLAPFYTTRTFPCMRSSTKLNLGAIANWISYHSFDRRFWQSQREMLNQGREEVLNLPRLSYWAGIIRWIHQKKIPCLFCHSLAFLPKPSDWPDWVHVTGYCFLEDFVDWQPPKELVEFIEAGSPPVYVGFGNKGDWSDWDKHWNSEKLTKMVTDAVAKLGQRAILLVGDDLTANIQLPKNVFTIKWGSFDWLFPRMKAVVHHGGLGTIHAALKAGVPSIIVPFDDENYFWGNRLTEQGLSPSSIEQKQLSAEKLADAIRFVIADKDINQKVREVSKQIQAEDGVAKTVEVFHQHLQNYESIKLNG
jgi:sterol 3beta-glucosyltransferase